MARRIKIGVIQLPSFYMDMDGARLGLTDYKSTTRDVRRLLEEFKTKNVDAVVVDLRWNGGGSLTEAVNMTGLFIDQGPVVQVKGSDGRTQPYKDPEPGLVWEGPLVVMINKFSASASEIFAGAIQDYGRGIVIGDQSTHGKGTVQQLFDLGNALFRAARSAEHGRAEAHDSAVLSPRRRQHAESRRRVRRRTAVAHHAARRRRIGPRLRAEVQPGRSAAARQLPHGRFRRSSMACASVRKTASTNSDFFKKVDREIGHYKELKDKKTVTLNKEKFLKEREELDNDKEQEKMFDAMTDPSRPVYDMNGYGKEALDIAVDYLDLLGANRVAVGRAAERHAGSRR